MQKAIEESAYTEARRQDAGESVVVGMNRFASTSGEPIPVMVVDPALERGQVERLDRWRSQRDAAQIHAELDAVTAVARTDENLLPTMKRALKSGATIGEVSDALRTVFGTHDHH